MKDGRQVGNVTIVQNFGINNIPNTLKIINKNINFRNDKYGTNGII